MIISIFLCHWSLLEDLLNMATEYCVAVTAVSLCSACVSFHRVIQTRLVKWPVNQDYLKLWSFGSFSEEICNGR
jgi:hypothetical protein